MNKNCYVVKNCYYLYKIYKKLIKFKLNVKLEDNRTLNLAVIEWGYLVKKSKIYLGKKTQMNKIKIATGSP